MANPHEPMLIPGVTDDPVIGLLLRGEARTLHEAEEMFLDSAMPEVLGLLAGPLSNEALGEHPLSRMVLLNGSRGWEDSLLRAPRRDSSSFWRRSLLPASPVW